MKSNKIQELMEQLKAAEAEEAARLEGISAASKVAGLAHTEVVLDLYELLGIKAEHATSRVDAKGKVIAVAVDKGEELRARRLYDVLAAVVEKADPALLARLKREDEAAREERKQAAEKARAAKGTTKKASSDVSPMVTSAPAAADRSGADGQAGRPDSPGQLAS